MGHDADEGEELWEAIDEDKESLDGDDGVYHARQKSLCYDSMFFDELRQIVQSRSCECISGSPSGYDAVPLPMAKVRKAKPRTMPRYPTSGRIQKFAIA